LISNVPKRIEAINQDEIPSRKDCPYFKGAMELKKGDQLMSPSGSIIEVIEHKKSKGTVTFHPVGGGPDYDRQKFTWTVPRIQKSGKVTKVNDFGTWKVLKTKWEPRYEQDSSGSE